MPRRKKVYGNCPYCGEYDKLTREHIIPECLFPDGVPLPGNLPKIHACADCNNKKKAGHDAILRDFLATDINGSKSPIAKELLLPFRRSAIRHQSVLAKAILERSQLVGLTTKSGIIYDIAYSVPEAQKWLNEIMSMIVRGLHYYYFHIPLSSQTHIEVMRLRDSGQLKEIIDLLHAGGGSYQMAGDGSVFECAFGIAHDVPKAGLWILNFNRRVAFTVFTGVEIPEEKHLAS